MHALCKAAPAALLIIAGALAVGQPAYAHTEVRVEGTWRCDNRGVVAPIAGARVELIEDGIGLNNPVLATTHTRSDGSYRFTLRTPSGHRIVWARLVLNDDIGVNLEDWWTSWEDWHHDTEAFETHTPLLRLGGTLARERGRGTPKCAIWQGAHNAWRDYLSLTGRDLPSGDFTVSAGWYWATPWTALDQVHWPVSYPTGARGDARGGYATSFHEFGHAIRHSLDGSLAHWLFDVIRFRYARSHNSCDVTSPGFAFNEGWAEYWEGTPAAFSCGPDHPRLSTEGLVAADLAALEPCTGRRTLVRVLQRNPGRIHDMREFRDALERLTGRRVCAAAARAASPATPPATTPDESPATTAQADIAAQRTLIADLERALRDARAQRPDTSRCAASACNKLARAMVLPSELETRIAQARLVLDAQTREFAEARATGFQPPLDRPSLTRSIRDKQRRLLAASRAILARGLRSGLDALAPAARRNQTGLAAPTRQLRDRLTQLSNLRDRDAPIPAALSLPVASNS